MGALRDEVPSVAFAHPVTSEVRIDGRLYRLESWTQAQWYAIPEQDRPGDAWRHGILIVRLSPS